MFNNVCCHSPSIVWAQGAEINLICTNCSAVWTPTSKGLKSESHGHYINGKRVFLSAIGMEAERATLRIGRQAQIPNSHSCRLCSLETVEAVQFDVIGSIMPLCWAHDLDAEDILQLASEAYPQRIPDLVNQFEETVIQYAEAYQRVGGTLVAGRIPDKVPDDEPEISVLRMVYQAYQEFLEQSTP